MDNKIRSARTVAAGISVLALGAALTVLGPSALSSAAQQPAAPFTAETPRAVLLGSPAAGTDDTAILGKDSESLEGLKIAPSAPKAWTPSSTSAGSDKFNYLVTVKFTNNGDKSVDLGDVLTEVNTDGGATHTVHDSANNVGMSIDAGRLAPGQTSTLKYGFSSESKPSYVNFDFTMFLGDDTAEFTYEW
ncbi:hypothetical protein OG864_52770 [Streptomyces sp. NBC_00124]|uniref:hypothetical protein n=1 Tax=Streptomyces sp. NBC_00124 TaxID=2975662 RepID=UPI00225AAF7C|nr:hypothetical protein [Streptomyces sp. NBC_00124]MCX5367329.1 hypothetical protein [Streptomyces sp. NBC_00124]